MKIPQPIRSLGFALLALALTPVLLLAIVLICCPIGIYTFLREPWE